MSAREQASIKSCDKHPHPQVCPRRQGAAVASDVWEPILRDLVHGCDEGYWTPEYLDAMKRAKEALDG